MKIKNFAFLYVLALSLTLQACGGGAGIIPEPSDGNSNAGATSPDTTAPDTTAPDTTAPDTTAPDTTAPDTTAPDTTAPDTTAPATPSGEVTIVGDWTLLNAAGALGVGPAQGDISWWSNDEAAVTIRDCLFDDIFRFTEDGTFSNEMGDSTWLDTHQAPPETCGAPVAPHDNSSAATYDYDEGNGTLTVTGSGAHIGLSKVINLAEIASSADAPASIEYLVTDLTATTMTLDIEIRTGDGGEGWWRFELVKTP